MAEEKNESRPVRKLTVKNFSVIKEAELEFGKITVLIGPQASGKSLLCKLNYFFEKIIAEEAEEAFKRGDVPGQFEEAMKTKFSEWFPDFRQERPISNIEFEDGEYKVSIELRSGIFPAIEVRMPRVAQAYREVLSTIQADESNAEVGLRENNVYAQSFRDALRKLRLGPEVFRYIPSTRASFVTPEQAVRTASSPGVDELTRRFGVDMSWSLKRPSAVHFDDSQARLHTFDEACRKLLEGEVKQQGHHFYFSAKDGRNIELDFLSSGTQELLPLLHSLRDFILLRTNNASAARRMLYVEEPEANVFPKTQYELVRIFARLANELDASWVLTTHSPYILTAFNTLIEAWRAGNRPGKHDQVAAIIPEHYWVNENDLCAYTIEDGVLVSIFEKEIEGKEGSGLINGDYLDAVSDRLGSDFDKLLDIEYAR